MDLNDADLAKTLECPVCLDVFDEPKLLLCGHTVCQKCVNKVVAARRNAANSRQARDRNCIKCPECNGETEIPPEGLATNYRLVDLVCRAQKSLADSSACNGCGKQALVVEMFTCESCQETLNCKPATRQQIEEACQGIASSGSSADMYIGLTMSHLSRAQKETELISQLLNQQRHGFVRLEDGVKSADKDLAQEDLATAQQAATDLEQKFTQASLFASEAGKVFESALRDCREKLEDLFPTEEDMETEHSGASHNNFDLGTFDDGQEVIDLSECRVDAIPDLSRFSELQLLVFRWNLITSINGNAAHTTLTELDLYGNRITGIHGLDALANLESLNVGYNRLRKIQGLTNLVKLKRLFLEDNAIEKIEGLDTLVNVELLQLSGNRIKAIENLDGQRSLSELYLDKNRIRRIENVSHLTKLRVLCIEGNRITKLENLGTLVDLEELYVAEQGIETLDGIQKLNNLRLIDGAKNLIGSLDHLGHLQQLVHLRLNGNKITEWPEVDKLAKLAKLATIQLEGNPIATQDHDVYRRRVVQALPQVTQLNDTLRC